MAEWTEKELEELFGKMTQKSMTDAEFRKEVLEDATKARLEVSELRRELAAREKEIASLRSRLARFTGGAGYHTEGDY